MSSDSQAGHKLLHKANAGLLGFELYFDLRFMPISKENFPENKKPLFTPPKLFGMLIWD